MLNFFKNHWFGFLISVFSIFFVAMILIVVSAPRQDKLERGFIPCTKAMMDEMLACPEDGGSFCIAKTIVHNSVCDISVIFKGVTNWVQGKQPRPWSNYFFEPEIESKLQSENVDEELEEFYRQNPDLQEQMKKLNQEREKLDKKLEEIKDERKLPE